MMLMGPRRWAANGRNRGVEFGKPITFENTREGVYAELREAMKIRDHLTTDLCVVQARVYNWLDCCRCHSI